MSRLHVKGRVSAVLAAGLLAITTPLVVLGGTADAVQVVAGGVTTNAQVNRAQATVGQPVSVTVAVTSETSRRALVDLEIYDSSNRQVFQMVWNNQWLPGGRTIQLDTAWATIGLPPDSYTIKIGVFHVGWMSLIQWNNHAESVVLVSDAPTSTDSPPPTTTPPTTTPPTTTPPTTTPPTTTTPSTASASPVTTTSTPPDTTTSTPPDTTTSTPPTTTTSPAAFHDAASTGLLGSLAVQVVSALSSNFDVSSYLVNGSPIPESSAWEPSGNFRATCSFSHLAYDDPIVYPGQPGRAHLHMFFGNTGTNASSTYSSLRESGNGTCDGGPINRSGYWAPAVFNAQGNVVIPDYISVYYKGPGHDVNGNLVDVMSMPAGLRMIAGYDMANPGGPDNHQWYCEINQVKSNTIPNCAPGERVGVNMSFPTCWNGQLDSADHRSHLSYEVRDPNSGQLRCPPSHPRALPRFELGIWFTHDSDSQNWYLSSDRMPGMPTQPNGSTFHSDWFGAWDPAIQNTWIQECINELRNCKSGQIGTGQSLKSFTPYTGPKIVTPPPRP